jgi:predicted transcriptional regulator
MGKTKSIRSQVSSLGVTLDRFAHFIGVQTSTIRRIDYGDVTPRPDTLTRVNAGLAELRRRAEANGGLAVVHLGEVLPALVTTAPPAPVSA